MKILSIKLIIFVVISGTLASHSLFAIECSPFELYSGIIQPEPVPFESSLEKNSEETIGNLTRQISNISGHERFKTLYESQRALASEVSPHIQIETLNCVLSYLKLDLDNDGINDWKIVSENQIFHSLRPQDTDWDNDGIVNLLDVHPTEPNIGLIKIESIPRHLWLSDDSNSSINRIQQRIFEVCGVLAVNHTDDHEEEALKIFYRFCEFTLKNLKQDPFTFVLYAFAGHSQIGDVVASFYPDMNFMSISGKTMKYDPSKKVDLQKTIGHEMGHYLTFRFLSPVELMQAAIKYGDWESNAKTPVMSLYDPLFFLKKLPKGEGFFPSQYSRTNIHEWISEVVSVFFQNILGQSISESKVQIPTELKNWLLSKFSFMNDSPSKNFSE